LPLPSCPILSYLIAALSRLPLCPSTTHLYSPRLQGYMLGRARGRGWGVRSHQSTVLAVRGYRYSHTHATRPVIWQSKACAMREVCGTSISINKGNASASCATHLAAVFVRYASRAAAAAACSTHPAMRESSCTPQVAPSSPRAPTHTSRTDHRLSPAVPTRQ